MADRQNGDGSGELNDYNNEMEEVIEMDSGEEDFNDMDGAEMDEGAAGELGDSEITDDSTCTFSEHKEPVFCIEFNPINSALVATGGQDDLAYLWNSVSGETVLKCTGHKDSVSHVKFSNDGSLLATADMSGLIQVWHISTKEMIWSFEISDLEWMDWHYGTKVLFASDAEGMVWMWKIPSGDCKTFANAGVAATCCQLLPGGSSLVTGYSNGILKVWDLSTASCKITISGNDGHQGNITSLAVLPEVSTQNNSFISAGVDGFMHLYNFKTGKLLKRFCCKSSAAVGEGEEDGTSVESLSLCSSRPLAAAATSAGDIFIFDLRSQTCQHKLNTNKIAVTRVQWHANSPLLYATDILGVLSLWDGRTGESTTKFYGHIAEIHDLAVSKQGVILASASEDGTAKVYAVSPEDPATT